MRLLLRVLVAGLLCIVVFHYVTYRVIAFLRGDPVTWQGDARDAREVREVRGERRAAATGRAVEKNGRVNLEKGTSLGLNEGLTTNIDRILSQSLKLPSPSSATKLAETEYKLDSGGQGVFVLGDVHADINNTIRLLMKFGLVNSSGHWTGGTKICVQTGDIVDRGESSLQVLELFIRLQEEAAAAGGRVINLIGNHEFMNLIDDLRYVADEDFAEFRDKLRRRNAFSSSGRYGQWLRQLPLAVQVDRTIMVHAGIEPKLAALGLTRINAALGILVRNDGITLDVDNIADKTDKSLVREVLHDEGSVIWTRLYGLAGDDVERRRRRYLKKRRRRRQAELERELRRRAQLKGERNEEGNDATTTAEETLDASSRHRDFVDMPSKSDPSDDDGDVCKQLQRALKLLDADRMVVGHTVQWGGVPVHVCEDALILNDVGISEAYGGYLGATYISADGAVSTVSVIDSSSSDLDSE